MQKKTPIITIEVPPKWKEDMIRLLKYGLSYVQPPPQKEFLDAINEWIEEEEKGIE